MKKTMRMLFGLLMVLTPTLQMFAAETSNERFKRELLSEIKKEIKDLSDEEIRAIINGVEKNLTDYIEHYEETAPENLLTKNEKLIEQHRSKAGAQQFDLLGHTKKQQTDEELLLSLKPRLQELPEDSYRINPETKEVEMTQTPGLANFGAPAAENFSRWRWDLLQKGDVLIDLDNGKLGFKWGHAGMMFDKGATPDQSTTLEILGFGDVVQFKNYKTTWHDNTTHRISHNYPIKSWGTDAGVKAAEYATRFIGKGYSLYPVLGDTDSFYCTELVFMAYRSQGIDLGHGMDMGSWGILFPKSMFCSPELDPYFMQNMSGGKGKVC